MSNFEYGGSLYRTERAMLDALMSDFMTAQGRTSDADVAEFFATTSDDALVAEMVRGWRMDQSLDDGPSWMDERGLTVADLIDAMARFRETWSERAHDDR